MLVNNEIGVIQDIQAIGTICRERGIVFHVDAAQATGKVAIDLERLPVDLMSLTAHKTYGPKGIGALYVRREPRVRIEAQMHGGGHERGLRSGTLATHQIVGMGECFRIAGEEMAAEVPRLRALRDRLFAALAGLPEVRVNGDMERRIANNLNISLDLANCDSLLSSLTDIAVSSASACSSGSALPSHVLQALGADGAAAGNAIRITVGRFNTEEEIDYAIGYLRGKIEDCRAGRLRAA
jgi:cysteine desulfurase